MLSLTPLKLSPLEDHPVCMSERLLNPKSNQQRTTQIMFEKFNVPAFSLSVSSRLALMASGRETGLVLESGHGSTTIVPIDNLMVLSQHPATTLLSDFAGAALDDHFARTLFTHRGYTFHTTRDRWVLKDIKERLCYVPLDYYLEMHTASTTSQLEKIYELPDRQVITLGAERFECPEALFQPSLMGRDCSNIADILDNALERWNPIPPEQRNTQKLAIVLAGGSTLFPGLAERLGLHLTSNQKLIAPHERKYSVWIGGSIFSSLPGLEPSCWISKEEYDEVGPPIVHRKW